jgi:hypothetical protein
LACIAVLVALLALTAAPGVTAQEEPAGKLTFTVGIINDVDSLNPFIGILAETYEVWALMYDNLVGYSQKDFSPVPGLAESWEVSDDELTWTYKIRQGVKWSDGQPVTARDAAYTFNRVLQGTFEQTNYGNYVGNLKDVKATDDTTLVMTTKEPSPSMLRLAVPILPEHIWKDIDEKEAFPTIGDQASRRNPHGLGGDPPDPRDLPSGCEFHPRCPLSIAACPTLDVELWPAGARSTGAPVPGSPDPSARRAACVHVRDGRPELVRDVPPHPVGEDAPAHLGREAAS